MKVEIIDVCSAVVLEYVMTKMTNYEKYSEEQWQAIADVLDTLVNVSEASDKLNGKL